MALHLYFTNGTIQVLKEIFNVKLTSRDGYVNWPPI